METDYGRVNRMFKTRRVPAWPNHPADEIVNSQPGQVTQLPDATAIPEEHTVTKPNTTGSQRIQDSVKQPSHYCTVTGIEAKDMIEAILNEHPELSPWEGYCLGNFLKYRLRLGDKDDIEQDLGKSNVYKGWFNDSRESPIPEHSHHFYDRERNQ